MIIEAIPRVVFFVLQPVTLSLIMDDCNYPSQGVYQLLEEKDASKILAYTGM